MKATTAASFIFLTAAACYGQASKSALRQVPSPTAYRVTKEEANSQVWQRETYQLSPEGNIITNIDKYTELATGMNYKDAGGQWQKSQELIESYPGGAIARHGQYQVIFANNLNSYGAIDMQTPDGKRLRSNILGLMYHDTASGDAVLIAQITNSTGVLISSNQVLYPNAFAGVKADVRYTYKKGSFEQDVILREQLPSPESYGMNPATTEVEVMTEFHNPPPEIVTQDGGQANGENDETVSWGRTRLWHGRAFSLGQGSNSSAQISVTRQYRTVDGRKVLLEKVPVESIQAALARLPQHASIRIKQPVMAFNQLNLPKPTTEQHDQKPIKLAMSTPSGTGYVLDYVSVSSGGGYVFQADSTYYISGYCYFDGYGTNITLEGGTVIKFATNADLAIGQNLVCDTTSYRPAVLTSKDDNSLGQTISGSTGTPSGYYATVALDVGASSTFAVHDIRIKYAETGLKDYEGLSSVTDCQFINCDSAIVHEYYGVLDINNVLFSSIAGQVMANDFEGDIHAANITVHHAGVLESEYGNAYITNSLFVCVTNMGGSVYGEYNATNSSDAGVFQIVGGGAHYLAEDSPYRDVGTTNIDPIVLADIAGKTTYPPIAYTNVHFTSAITFSPQAQRDSDAPDLGYHYDPLDYTFGGCWAYSNMTFTAGTAVGWFRTSSTWYHGGQAIRMIGDMTVSFNGTVTSPAYWVRLNTVQEQDNSAGYGHGSIENWEDPAMPMVRGRFLRCTTMANESFNGYFADDYGSIKSEMTDSEFFSGALFTYGDDMRYTNCLMWRLNMGLSGGKSSDARILQNCTFYGGQYGMNRSSAGTFPVSVRDSAFDGTAISTSGDYYGTNPTWTDYDYNAYTNSTDPFSVGGMHDVIMTNGFNWQSSWLGDYYLPSDSSLLDVGSTTADQVGLYWFTTQTNQSPEYNYQVDIGYHYVALDYYGNPNDSDGDGIPDYIEDANGNGVVDTGETSPYDSDDQGLEVIITNPKN